MKPQLTKCICVEENDCRGLCNCSCHAALPTLESDWEKKFDKLFVCSCMLCQEKGHEFSTKAEFMKDFIRTTLSAHRHSLIREINQLKIDTPPYPMEGPNAEMITWVARKGYIDALNEVLSHLDK